MSAILSFFSFKCTLSASPVPDIPLAMTTSETKKNTRVLERVALKEN